MTTPQPPADVLAFLDEDERRAEREDVPSPYWWAERLDASRRESADLRRQLEEARVECSALRRDVIGLRYALEMAEAAEDLAGMEAYQETNEHAVEMAKQQMHETERMNAMLAAERDEALAALQKADDVFDAADSMEEHEGRILVSGWVIFKEAWESVRAALTKATGGGS